MRNTFRLLMVALAAMMTTALFAAGAQAQPTKPGYEQFTGCPSFTENPASANCVRNVISSGKFKMGNKDVPITAPIVLVGGVDEAQNGFVYNKYGGLLPAKQKVPGGVIGLTGLTWLAEFLGIEALTLYAVTELAGTPNLHDLANPVLPVKVHLINGALGNNCYVGSTSNPITLKLTTGTTAPPAPNKPISGKNPTSIYDAAKEILTLNNGTYVDNSFSAPGASGCVLTLFGFIPISINGLVNTSSGLPAASGSNETIQNFSAEVAAEETVYNP